MDQRVEDRERGIRIGDEAEGFHGVEAPVFYSLVEKVAYCRHISISAGFVNLVVVVGRCGLVGKWVVEWTGVNILSRGGEAREEETGDKLWVREFGVEFSENGHQRTRSEKWRFYGINFMLC